MVFCGGGGVLVVAYFVFALFSKNFKINGASFF